MTLALALFAGCGRTEVVLFAQSDLTTAQLPAVELHVRGGENGLLEQRRCICLGRGCTAEPDIALIDASWPISAALRPGQSSQPPFTVELRGYAGAACAGEPALTQVARARFVEHRRLLLRMSLSASCLSVACTASETTCRDGACLPIDTPLEELPGELPLGSGDLGPAPDLAGPTNRDDLAVQVDLPPPDLSPSGSFGAITPLVFLGSASSISPPAIAYHRVRGEYSIADVEVTTTPTLMARVIDPATGMSLSSLNLSSSRTPTLLRPALVVDSDDYVAAYADGSSSYVSRYTPGIAPNLPTSLSGSPSQLAMTPSLNGVRVARSIGGILGIEEFSRTTGMPGNKVEEVTGGGALAMSGNTGGGYAAWFDLSPADGLLVVRDGVLPPLKTNQSMDAPLLVAAASDDLHHFVVERTATGLRYASLQSIAFVTTPMTLTLPIANAGTPTSLALAFDHGELLLAYTTASGLEEVVFSVIGVNTLVSLRSRSLLSGTEESFSGIAYAPGPVAGGGRYTWLRRGLVVPTTELVTMARDAALP